MKTVGMVFLFVFLLTACIPATETPALLPLENAIQTSIAATEAAGGSIGPPATTPVAPGNDGIPANYSIPIGSQVILVCLDCEDPTDTTLTLWQTPDEETSVGDIPYNTMAVVLEDTTRADGKPFYKVKTEKLEGWITKDMVFLFDDTIKSIMAATQAAHPKSGTPSILVCDDCTELDNGITLWETPDELNALIDLPINSEVTILEEQINSDGKAFYKVRAGDKEGWVVQDMVKPK